MQCSVVWRLWNKNSLFLLLLLILSLCFGSISLILLRFALVSVSFPLLHVSTTTHHTTVIILRLLLMERVVGKKIEKEVEKEMDMLQNEIFAVTSPERHHHYHYQSDSGFSANYGIGAVDGDGGLSSLPSYFTPSSPSPRRPSPGLESERLMEEYGILERFQAVHVHNDDIWRIPQSTNALIVHPLAEYVGGGDFGDSNPNVDWVAELVEQKRLANVFANHGTCVLNSATSPIASAVSSPFYGGDIDVFDGNGSPLLNGFPQPTGFDSSWNMVGGGGDGFYLPVLNHPVAFHELNPSLSVLGQHIGQDDLIKMVADVNPFACDDSFIMQGNDLRFFANRDRAVRRGIDRERERSNVDELCSPVSTRASYGSSFRMQKYDSLLDLRGCIYFVAKDQQGCRFLQRKFDERNAEDIEMIFNELIGHVAELMINAFANYLMQKLFDVCTEEQRLSVILVLTQRPFELVEVSLNNHGTRSVQKLIDTLQTQQQKDLVISALQPGFLILIKDLNGHHVIQKCLQCLSIEENKFIFDSAAKHCIKIATDQHGCCVLQRCIMHSTGQYQLNLVVKIATNGLLLAQHPFGNYAVQFVIDMNNPLANGNLMSRFKGNFVELSKNKFSSNVVEKCVKTWEEGRRTIVLELLAAPHFDMLLQHQYANYVIQRALSYSKGPLHDALVSAIRPHESILRTSPYCKKIFSKPYFKKCTSY